MTGPCTCPACGDGQPPTGYAAWFGRLPPPRRPAPEPAPLVAGSVYGLRQWRIGSSPQGPILHPLFGHDPLPWRPGWNDARCHGRLADVAAYCGCGFYAYTAAPSWPGMLILNGSDRVTGIIEGAGTTELCERGFRAQRARVVALIAPPGRLWTSLVALVFILAAVALCGHAAFTSTTEVARVGFALLVALNLTAACWWTAQVAGLVGPRAATRRLARVYGVRIHRSVESASRAHPLGLADPKEPA